MSRYQLREKAEADLADIWRYTAQHWNVEQADRYYHGIVEAMIALAEEPTLGRPCNDIREGYCRHNVAAHVIFFRIENGQIDVVRALHARRDFRRHLPSA